MALKNITKYCKEHLEGQYTIEVIDLLKNPQLAEGDQIFAIPTLVRKFPEPIRKIIGDLSNEEQVLVGLNIRPLKSKKTTNHEKQSKAIFIAGGKLILQLYVSGMSPKSMEAIENIKCLCDEHLKDAFELEIIDIYKNPEAGSSNSTLFSVHRLLSNFLCPKKR